MILCAGESLIDMLPRDTASGEPAFAPYPGGSVLNTAIALGRLGVETGFLSGISTDLFGQMLDRALSASDVDGRFVIRSDRPSTLAFVTLSDGQARYAFYDENTAGRMITPDDLPLLPDRVDALFFGGISLVVDPCAATYEALMQREAANRVTMIDPNVRAGFITDEVSYRARIDRMLALADIVKVSDEDLAWLGMDVATMMAMGPKVVCVTEGSKGVTAHTMAGPCRVTATKADVVDTVGAGDTFNAGFLAGLKQAGLLRRDALVGIAPEDLHAALSLGAAAAAITVSRAGANPPWARELA